MTPITAKLLQAGEQTVRIVCFGDSITGVYYHTGGVRAYTAMLGIALQRIYPEAKLQMINAGISGHTTANGLARIQRDVLNHKPHLVTVMFGMNDLVRVSDQDFHDNLVRIVTQCRGQGAEVILCTPNNIYMEDAQRPLRRLAEYAQVVRDVAAEQDVPLVDCYREYERVQERDRREWMLLMSETIHPGMNGHKLFAEMLAQSVSGKRVSLRDVGPVFPSIARTLLLLKHAKPVKVLAMPPYDALIEEALQAVDPDATVQVTPWPVQGQTLAQIEAFAKQVRAKRPDLVVVAIPAAAGAQTLEQFIRSYSWVLNWSLSFGRKEWDCFAVLPGVASPHLSPQHAAAEALATDIVRGQDIGVLVRLKGDTSSPRDILMRWLRAQAGR